jgi:hypothetical protein
MRMAGRFSRRVRGWAQAHGVPVIDCKNQERKHEIAEEFLRKNACVRGVLILVSRAPATVWNVQRSKSGVIVNRVPGARFKDFSHDSTSTARIC